MEPPSVLPRGGRTFTISELPTDVPRAPVCLPDGTVLPWVDDYVATLPEKHRAPFLARIARDAESWQAAARGVQVGLTYDDWAAGAVALSLSVGGRDARPVHLHEVASLMKLLEVCRPDTSAALRLWPEPGLGDIDELVAVLRAGEVLQCERSKDGKVSVELAPEARDLAEVGAERLLREFTALPRRMRLDARDEALLVLFDGPVSPVGLGQWMVVHRPSTGEATELLLAHVAAGLAKYDSKSTTYELTEAGKAAVRRLHEQHDLGPAMGADPVQTPQPAPEPPTLTKRRTSVAGPTVEVVRRTRGPAVVRTLISETAAAADAVITGPTPKDDPLGPPMFSFSLSYSIAALALGELSRHDTRGHGSLTYTLKRQKVPMKDRRERQLVGDTMRALVELGLVEIELSPAEQDGKQVLHAHYRAADAVGNRPVGVSLEQLVRDAALPGGWSALSREDRAMVVLARGPATQGGIARDVFGAQAGEEGSAAEVLRAIRKQGLAHLLPTLAGVACDTDTFCLTPAGFDRAASLTIKHKLG